MERAIYLSGDKEVERFRTSWPRSLFFSFGSDAPRDLVRTRRCSASCGGSWARRRAALHPSARISGVLVRLAEADSRTRGRGLSRNRAGSTRLQLKR